MRSSAQTFLTGLAFLLAAGSITRADGINVSQSLDHAAIAYEESATFEIKLTWNGPISAYLIDGPIRLDLQRLTVERYASSISASGSGPNEITTKTFTYTLKPSASGLGLIESLEISYISWPDSIPGTIFTSSLEISIANRQKKSELSSGWRNNTTVIGLGILILAGMVGAGALVFVRRRKRSMENVKSPVERFLAELRNLKTEAGSDLKLFQIGLFKYLVIFLSEHCSLKLAGLTSDEIIARLDSTNLTLSQRDSIAGWLRRAEREKYSPSTASPGETIRLETEIRQAFEKLT